MSQNIVDGNYIPSFPPERGLYESLWKYANPNGEENLGGQLAVPFFQKSGVDTGILRQVWSTLAAMSFTFLIDMDFINCG
jgi:hypothetical protein